MASTKKTRIRYFDTVCGMATLFKSEQIAIIAAAEESKRRGYQCEIVRCDRDHVLRNGQDEGVGWHIRGVNFH
jgi:hypothetical protein